MKPGLAVLPLEVWADVTEHPLITRELLAEIANVNGDPGFTAKLDKLLHGCGKHTLRHLEISKDEDSDENHLLVIYSYRRCIAEECEFPECDMPENIKGFKRLKICHLDDQVLDFLHKIKPLFTNVKLQIKTGTGLKTNLPILLAHLLPMLGNGDNICAISCGDIQMLEQHFPGTLARAKELHSDESASIPALLDWLNAPQDFDVHGPRFLRIYVSRTRRASTIIDDIVAAVCKQFLAATTSATFVIHVELDFGMVLPPSPEEPPLKNAATNEELTIRNAIFKSEFGPTHYVEVLRYPTGANARMQEWVKQRAYFEQYVKCLKEEGDGAEQVIFTCPYTIGQISDKSKQKAGAMGQGENGSIAGGEDQAGPSTSA